MEPINPFIRVGDQVLLGGAVKQNPALAHATIVLVSRKYPEVRFAGISFASGFFVFGDVPTEAIIPAANEALTLLRTTHPEIAIHDRCGNNLAVSVLLACISAMFAARMLSLYHSVNMVIL